ncbi:MAG: hypothetical protein WBG17_02865, partial [Burkholderiaceae bacterium]
GGFGAGRRGGGEAIDFHPQAGSWRGTAKAAALGTKLVIYLRQTGPRAGSRRKAGSGPRIRTV